MAEQINQRKKKPGVGKDSYLRVFFETAVNFLDKNYIFRKILEKYLLKSSFLAN